MQVTEEWRDIAGYEGLYQVSNLGRVKSLKRVQNGNSRRCVYPERIRAIHNSRVGYPMVGLWKDSHMKLLSVHRLVAVAFLPNPNNLPEVNHKDEDKTNNCVDNLEWCTKDYNYNYGTRSHRCSMSLRLTKHSKELSKTVFMYDECGNVIRTFSSTGEASRVLGIPKRRIQYECSVYGTGIAHTNIIKGYSLRYQ